MTGAPVSGITAYLHRLRNTHLRQRHEVEGAITPVSTVENQSMVCTHCGAVYHQNRWTWDAMPHNSSETLCPACRRVRDREPAAILTVRGDCLTEHKTEILKLIRNRVQNICKQYPLKRIIDMEDDETEAVFTFTDEQLTREIGDALHKTYDGVLDFQYSKEDNLLRVIWQR